MNFDEFLLDSNIRIADELLNVTLIVYFDVVSIF